MEMGGVVVMVRIAGSGLYRDSLNHQEKKRTAAIAEKNQLLLQLFGDAFFDERGSIPPYPDSSR